MDRIRKFIMLVFVGALIVAILPAETQQGPYGSSDRQTEQVLRRLEQDGNLFARSVDQALLRGRIDNSRPGDSIRQVVVEYQEATAHLREHFNRQQVGVFDVEELLRRGSNIERFIQRRPLGARVDNDWRNLRRDLDDLARAFNVAWDWNNPRYRTAESEGGGLYFRLTGTYQLERNRSDDPRQAADQATRALPGNQRRRVYENLVNRLEAPDVLAIDRRGNDVTLASSTGPRLDFEADGQVRTERLPDGRTISTRAILYGDQLRVSTTGNRGNDFTVTFEPTDNGRSLRVTRQISSDGLRQPVTTQSFYRKSSDQARWDIYTGNPQDRYASGTASADFLVPNGTRFVVTLDSPLSTRTSQGGDRFSMTVRGSSQYDGAVIEGSVSSLNASGRGGSRTDMSLDFQSIRLRDGRTGRFEGFIETLRTPDGETVRVDNEGRAEGDGRGGKAVERGALGAALGALIGAAAGGGKGAAIGAAIGAGVGASTVFIQGRDHLDLQRGTELTISSAAPR